MTKDLLLDTQIRTWVFLPIVILTFFMELIKHYIAILTSGDKNDVDLQDVQFNHIQKRANLIMENHGYITKKAFILRKQMLNPETGLLKIQPKSSPMVSTNIVENHTKMMGHIQNQAVNICPMILAGAFVSYCFSGFITTKVPIPLTLAFKEMLQRDIELSCLNPQWVSSISWYTGGLFKKSINRTLQESDIYEVIKPCESKKNGDLFEKKWKKQRGNHSMARLLFACFGWKYIIFGAIHLTNQLVHSIIDPQAISKLVRYFKPRQNDVTFDDAIHYACLYIGLKIFNAFYDQNYTIYVQQLSIQIRSSFCSLIYRKALRLTPEAMNEIGVGNIITLITKDVLQFENAITMFNQMWVEMIRMFVVSYLIYAKMGTAGFVGIGVVLCIVPAQVYIGKRIRDLRLDLSKKTDERLQATQETMSAIKMIKMYTWERVFAKKVEEKRKKEMIYLLKSQYLLSLNAVIGAFMSQVGFYALIMTYIHLNADASSDVVFYASSCFKSLKNSVHTLIPIGLGKGAALLASGSRVNKILNSEEQEETYDQSCDKLPLHPKIKVSNVTVAVKDKEILKEISTEIKAGLTVISGSLGSGKSALLKLFLRDFPVKDGKIVAQGKFSYCSQDPWLFPSSIKQNILFGEPYNEERYNMVVKVCALEYDLNLLESGDETIVQDRGMNLSGGQQARVNLARAIYKKSDIYLLDEPLHALDAKVQEFIFQNCIQEFLKDKYVVMVSHNLKHRNSSDNLIVLNDGKIVFDGKPQKADTENIEEINKEMPTEILSTSEELKSANLDDTEIIKRQYIKSKIYAETKKEGMVEWKIYRKYLVFGGGFLPFAGILSIFVAEQFAGKYGSKFLTNWLNYQEKLLDLNLNSTSLSNSTISEEISKIEADSNWVLKLYTASIFLSVTINLLKRLSFISFCRRASVKLHDYMIEKISTARMTFFDSYFIGNILNRFSQDLSVIDEGLPNVLTTFLGELIGTGATIILVASIHWELLIPAVILMLILVALRSLYMPTARSLKRLEAATRSPLIGHLNASMEGVTTIRASQAQQILEEEFDKHQDLFTSAHYMTFCVNGAFVFFMNILCAIFMGVVVAKLLFYDSGELSGNVGLILTQSDSLASVIHYLLIYWSNLENEIISVERVLNYTEAPQEDYSGQIIENWPSRGSVAYENVSLKYKDEKVLREISFEVKSKEKIGIVGRTGAGKSSIISALFRLYKYKGSIKIDDIDIQVPPLRFLRDNISVIVQQPLLFQGTIRQNIDPLNQYNDHEIWQALEKVYMAPQIGSLDMLVEEYGCNFSTGQRQLICLGRAIVRRNKIVILDEATSNLDLETELLVQTVIDRQFSESTLLIVAHRLQSVLKCDKVMVLDKGRIIEYDRPQKLLENPDSFFREMLFIDRERCTKTD